MRMPLERGRAAVVSESSTRAGGAGSKAALWRGCWWEAWARHLEGLSVGLLGILATGRLAPSEGVTRERPK